MASVLTPQNPQKYPYSNNHTKQIKFRIPYEQLQLILHIITANFTKEISPRERPSNKYYQGTRNVFQITAITSYSLN